MSLLPFPHQSFSRNQVIAIAANTHRWSLIHIETSDIYLFLLSIVYNLQISTSFCLQIYKFNLWFILIGAQHTDKVSLVIIIHCIQSIYFLLSPSSLLEWNISKKTDIFSPWCLTSDLVILIILIINFYAPSRYFLDVYFYASALHQSLNQISTKPLCICFLLHESSFLVAPNVNLK